MLRPMHGQKVVPMLYTQDMVSDVCTQLQNLPPCSASSNLLHPIQVNAPLALCIG